MIGRLYRLLGQLVLAWRQDFVTVGFLFLQITRRLKPGQTLSSSRDTQASPAAKRASLQAPPPATFPGRATRPPFAQFLFGHR